MGLWQDIRLNVAKFLDVLQPFKRYRRFPHQLRDFPLPSRRVLPDPLPSVAILTPCKDAERCIRPYFTLIEALDYPKERLHLRVLEGDSSDATAVLAAESLERAKGYGSAALITHHLGVDAGEGRRSRPEFQRIRRGAIARCRNRLMRAALETDAAYFLFIDVDMVEIEPRTLRKLLEYDAPVLMANCLLQGSDAVFDLNAFRYTRPISDQMARRFVLDGIYQPPKGYFRDYCDRSLGNLVEPLHSVGGTVLLVRRDVAEAGVVFPEEPFHLHIETEGFALMAAEAGFGSFVLPQVLVYHPWDT